MRSLQLAVSESRLVKLVFYSKLAFYPIHWEAFQYLCTHYRVSGTVIANAPTSLSAVHHQLGWVNPETISKDHLGSDIRLVPKADQATQARWLRHELQTIVPDAVWVQEEPTDYFLFQILWAYFFDRRPRIVTAIAENIFPPGPLPIRLIKKVLWSRLDGLLAVATASVKGIRSAGMPTSVPATTLVAGALLPPDEVEPLVLPFTRMEEDFVVGFAGRICEEKGWKVLLTALQGLPTYVRCVIAGDGPQLSELHSWLRDPNLRDRVFYVGLLPKDILWKFYRALDCLVVPSLTTQTWKEQFGGVLADGMAMGLPLIGSDSGSIPEVIGPAGLVVPEGQPHALANAIRALRGDNGLRKKFSEAGRQRFHWEFAIPAYACKIAKALQLVER